MKNHILTIILLLLAVLAFVLRFFWDEQYVLFCDILAFALPTLAAIVEIVIAEWSGKKMEQEIKKRAVWETLTQEEYERRKAEGTITVVLRPDESSKKFNVLPLCWIVERSFLWLENFRRIAMDYEFYSDTGEAMVQLAFCRLRYNKIYD